MLSFTDCKNVGLKLKSISLLTGNSLEKDMLHIFTSIHAMQECRINPSSYYHQKIELFWPVLLFKCLLNFEDNFEDE